MSGQWKPGDLAMVTWEEPSGRSTIESTERAEFTGAAWVWIGSPPPAPLVVIDPEDAEAVERLARESHDRIHKPGSFDDLSPMSQEALGELMQAALREFANPTPPKPDEPQGLGAVVRDAAGKTWVRVGRRSDWYQAHGKWAQYHSIDAVEVLSEGVIA